MANDDHVMWIGEGPGPWNARRQDAPFGPDLREVNLTDANLASANLSSADLTDAHLTSTGRLDGPPDTITTLRNADLSAATLDRALLLRVDLAGCNLRGASLRDTHLYECNLTDAHLHDADLTGTLLTESRPWTANLFPPTTRGRPRFEPACSAIGGVSDLLEACRELEEYSDSSARLYLRGERRDDWQLRPSIMRSDEGEDSILRDVEGEMLNELMARQPASFEGLRAGLAQWVLAQHHGLRTRLLDITRNPLVALFYACEGQEPEGADHNGRIHVFAVPPRLVKPFNSDTLRVIANFAKLPRREQDVLLGKSNADMPGASMRERFEYFAGGLSGVYSFVQRHLYAVIREEKPYYEPRIDPRHLFSVFVVEPEQSLARIRAQAGAFLVSAFHERFEPDEILRWNLETPVYAHCVLSVAAREKPGLLSDLRRLGVTRETLFPGLDEAAKAIERDFLEHP